MILLSCGGAHSANKCAGRAALFMPKLSVILACYNARPFIGRMLPVYYDPADPAHAYTDRINRHFFDQVDGDTEADSASGEHKDASHTGR